MAKIVNTFVKGKLNKDLEARLLPNGEYRDARNIQVSKSEGPDVGELENVLGNEKLFDWDDATTKISATCIGYITDEINNCAYLFLTSYTDDNPLNLQYSPGNLSQIIKFDAFNNTSVILLQGNYLNFSTTHPIFGVNIVENLLFWTDNRNQPRVINLEKAEANPYGSPNPHYTNEDQISVAKYNPYEAITLWQEIGSTGTYETTMKDVTSKVLPNGATAKVSVAASASGVPAGIIVDPSSWEGWKDTTPQSTLLTAYPDTKVGYIAGSGVDEGCLKANFNNLTDIAIPDFNNPPTPSGFPTSITVASLSYDLDVDDEILINPNPYYDCNFAGDPAYLDDKFVRFSYRFRFEDNEYSILAPFTQIAFIPQQDGYFIYKKQQNPDITKDDMANAYQSTIVEFMENKVDDIKLIIPLPFAADVLRNNLKIKELDIIYKESDGLAVRVVDTIPIATIEAESGSESFYAFDYLSKQPIKTLPNDEIVRVFDKIPVRALAQEISGNRVIYGNYLNKQTPPETLNYNVSVSDKSEFNLNLATAEKDGAPIPPASSFTLTLNPATVVGDINIGDKASVPAIGIPNLGTVVDTDGTTYVTLDQSNTLGNGNIILFKPAGPDVDTTSKIEYPNHTLKQNRNYQVGFVLSDRYGRQSSVILSNNKDLVTLASGSSFIGDTVYASYLPDGTDQVSWPGDSLKVLVNDPIGPTAKIPSTFYPGLYNGDVSSSDYNPLGWYSYKIVVKQTEQEYYNVYLPGIMAAYPEDVTLEPRQTSHVVLINDNINKVPRDLNEVGPEQRQFRSSVGLFGRVQNTALTISYNSGIQDFIWSGNMGEANTQYYPERKSDTVSTISTMYDLFDYNPLDPAKPNYYKQFYLYESNPLIARVSVEEPIGQIATTNYQPWACTVVDDSIAGGSPDVNVTTIPVPTPAPFEPEIGDVVTGANLPEGIVVEQYTINAAPVPDVLRLQDSDGTSYRASLKEGDVLYIAPGFGGSENKGALRLPGIQYLGIYETSPVVSNIDIYWETTSSGLIDDLNLLILSESQGGADISGFDVSTWDEALISGGDILDTEFEIVDVFGVPVPTADPAVLLEFDVSMSVTDGYTPGNPVDNYFTLVQTGVIGDAQITFQIETTGDYYDAVYYSTIPQDRLFTFTFDIHTVVVVDGTPQETNVTVPVSLVGPGNVAPIVTAATNPVYTNRLDTSVLFETRGINGANNPDLRTSDLTASITSLSYNINGTITAVNSSDYGTIFQQNSYTDNVTNELVHEITFTNSSIPVADYTIIVEYTDAAESTPVTYELILNEIDSLAAVNGVQEILFYCEGGLEAGPGSEQTLTRILVDTSATASYNGYYLYIGTFAELVNSTQVITLDNTNAATGALANCTAEFFFASLASGDDFDDLQLLALNSGCLNIECEDYDGSSQPGWPNACNPISTTPCPTFDSPVTVDTTPYTMEII
tara:strand:+ start:1948 stop:6288 length:4341 start_codon:yes stop_codon:yes gene_type:complete